MATATPKWTHPAANQKGVHTVSSPPNAKRTMEALREMGYDSYASIMDLIDNSIDAGASQIAITVREDKDDIVIAIYDDGSGMNEETLREAIRLGSDTERQSGNLGKFGMGLVTATIGLSKKVEVITYLEDVDGQTSLQGPALYASFDLDEIAEKNEFMGHVGKASAGQISHLAYSKGTTIFLSKTDRISNKDTKTFADTLRLRIGRVFRKFIDSAVEISVNGIKSESVDPLMLAHKDTRLLHKTNIEIDGEGEFSIKAVEVPDWGQAANAKAGINSQNSGFYVVRNNREIMAAQNFGFYKKHGDYSHFRAELCFDGTMDSVFHTNISKMSIHLEQKIKDRLREEVQGLIASCGVSGKRRMNATKGGLDHSIAESNIKKRATLIPKPLTLVEKRKRKKAKGSHETGAGERERIPHATHLKTRNGLEAKFEEANYGKQGPFYEVDQKGKQVIITYNREHPFWRELIEHQENMRVVAIIDYLVFSLAMTEFFVPEEAELVKLNMNSTLVGLLV